MEKGRRVSFVVVVVVDTTATAGTVVFLQSPRLLLERAGALDSMGFMFGVGLALRRPRWVVATQRGCEVMIREPFDFDDADACDGAEPGTFLGRSGGHCGRHVAVLQCVAAAVGLLL